MQCCFFIFFIWCVFLQGPVSRGKKERGGDVIKSERKKVTIITEAKRFFLSSGRTSKLLCVHFCYIELFVDILLQKLQVTSCEKYGTRSSLYIIFPREFVFSFGKFAKKHERALMSADARERKTFSLISHMRARTHSSCFFCLNARQKFHHSLELVSMVQLSQCQQKWFILFHVFCLFHFFCLRSVLCVLRACFQQARQKRTRVLFLKRAQVQRRC